MRYSSIGLRSTVEFGKIRDILTIENENTMRFSRVKVWMSAKEN